MTGGIRMD